MRNTIYSHMAYGEKGAEEICRRARELSEPP